MARADPDVEAALLRLESLAPRFEIEEERPLIVPALRGAAGRIERALGRATADAVRTFFGRCDAVQAMSVHNGVWIGKSSWLVSTLEHYDHPRPEPGEAKRRARMSAALFGSAEALLPTFSPDPRSVTVDGATMPALLFGTDGGGNTFLLGGSGEGPAFWRDHETGRTRAVAPSLVGLLARMAEDWEHHLADDHAWRYLA
jgi:hypothetical protein